MNAPRVALTGAHFKNEDFQFGLELALGATYHGCADAGEVLATALRIADGDAESWWREWLTVAEQTERSAAQARQNGRQQGAVAHLRRTCTYYATALHCVASTRDADARQLEVWRRQRACWDLLVDLLPVPGERVAIPYGPATLPGYFFRAPDADAGERRPLVIVNNGSDGATSQTYLHGGAAAAARGYHWMTFDGPGQQATWFEQQIGFRHDWEAVLTPVLDSMLAREDVAAEHVAVVGISQAGYWVPRTLCHEHRFAAAVADPGVTDVATSWLEPLPGLMRKQLDEGSRDAFDREMRLVERTSHEIRAALRFRGDPYALGRESRYDLYQAVRAYRLADEDLARITTPLLITDPEGEQFWPGQARALYDRAGGPKEIVAFTDAEGAGGHCEPLAGALRDSRVFDWLDGFLRDDPHVAAGRSAA